MYLLYLLSDVLHHRQLQFQQQEISQPADSASPPFKALEILLENCLTSAARASSKRSHQKTLTSLLSLWRSKSYLPSGTLQTLQHGLSTARTASIQPMGASATHPSSTLPETSGTPQRPSGSAPALENILPATHGDPLTAWYDLPAGNMIPLITPGSLRPINSRLMRATPLKGGVAEPALVKAVDGLLADVKRAYGGKSEEDENGDGEGEYDIDAMGQELVVRRDRETGVVRREVRETYYGWSAEFCRRMQRLRKGEEEEEEDRRSFSRGRRGSNRSSNSNSSRSRSRSRRRSRRRSRSRSSRMGIGMGLGAGTGPRGRRPSSDRRPYDSRSGSSRSRSPRQRAPAFGAGPSVHGRGDRRRGPSSYSRSPARLRQTPLHQAPKTFQAAATQSVGQLDGLAPLPHMQPWGLPMPPPPPPPMGFVGTWPPPPPPPPVGLDPQMAFPSGYLPPHPPPPSGP